MLKGWFGNPLCLRRSKQRPNFSHSCPKTFRLGSQLEPDVIGNVIGNVTGVPKGFGSGPPGSQNVTGNVTGVPM